MTSPRRKRRVRVPAATRSSVGLSSPAKNGIRASDSSRRALLHHGRILAPAARSDADTRPVVGDRWAVAPGRSAAHRAPRMAR